MRTWLRLACVLAGAASIASTSARAELSLVEDHQDLVHLLGARQVVPSPDGLHLYVAVPTGNAITVLARTSATGAIAHLDSIVDGTNGVDGLAGVDAIAIAPDGSSVYSFGPEGVGVFARDAGSGGLTFVEIEIDDEGTLFAVPTGGAVRADGTAVYVSSYGDSSVASFARAGDGSLTYLGATDRVGTPQPGLFGADCVVVSPDAKDAYVCGALDRAVVYLRSVPPSDGLLAPTGYVPEYFIPSGPQVPLHGVTEGAISADGLFAYFAVDFARSIVAFTREPATSYLYHLQTVADGAAAGGSRGPQSVALHPNGARLYASVLDAPDAATGAVTAFTRASDGTLAFREKLEGPTTPGLAWQDPGRLALSPDGAHLYVPDASGFVKALATNAPEPDAIALAWGALLSLASLAARR